VIYAWCLRNNHFHWLGRKLFILTILDIKLLNGCTVAALQAAPGLHSGYTECL
jgi:hypothetical protein